MTEEFLHYLWKFRIFDSRKLHTTDKEEIQILQNGIHNHNAGPDFSNARIRIGGQLWAGNVEIHIKSSDWFKHKHHADPSYNSVILHVVYEDERQVINADGNKMPTLVLKGLFDEYQYWRYEQMVQNKDIIPCAIQLERVDPFLQSNMLERVLVERLQDKSNLIHQILKASQYHWEESFYQWLCRGFGLKVNIEPMEMLARNLPLKILFRHRYDRLQIEALLFGVSGLNNNPQDDYSRSLSREFLFLKKKYNLQSLEKSIWKFSRLRPPSFPTLRLAQFAGLIYKKGNLFSDVLSTGHIHILKDLLDAKESEYWADHYRFNKESIRKKTGMGEGFTELLIINVIVPFLFAYGHQTDQPFYKQRAMDLLDQLPPEENKIVRIYRELQFRMDSAFYSQAVLQLHKYYCDPKKCLNCAIGTNLLRNNDK